MTIAIGILAKKGVVIAADTQETLGSFKLTQSKILRANRGKKAEKAGALAVSGAGYGAYLDSIKQELCELFSGMNQLTGKILTGGLKAKVKQFHADHVVPLTGLPIEYRPTFSLVIGANIGGTGHLWTTEESTVWKAHIKNQGYVAVGIGASFAREMLDRYFTEMDVATVATLAAYVMFRVKRAVEGCGDKTQIVFIENGYASFVPQENIQRLESVFDEQMTLEGRMLHFVLGPQDENGLESNLKEFSARLKDFRDQIAQIQHTLFFNLKVGRIELEQPEYQQEGE